jgi:hypothetical protein
VPTRKIRAVVVGAIAAAALALPAAPAHAFMCEPDLAAACRVIFGPLCGGLPKTTNCY